MLFKCKGDFLLSSLRNSPQGTSLSKGILRQSLSSPIYKPLKIKMSHNEYKGKKKLLKDVIDSKHKRERYTH